MAAETQNVAFVSFEMSSFVRQKWKNGDIMELLHEGHVIQQRLPERWQPSMNNDKFIKTFTSLMFRGKVREATQLLNKQTSRGDVLSLDDQVEHKGGLQSVCEN